MGYEELHKEGFEDIRAGNFSDEVRNGYKGKILEFLRFPFDFSEIESVSEFDKNKFSLRYLRGNRYHDFDDIGEQLFSKNIAPLHFEGPYNLILYYDDIPLFTVAYSNLGSAIFIHQIQGITHRKGESTNDREKEQAKENFYLERLDWTRLAVSMIERFGRMQGKERLYIQPAEWNKWITIKHIVYPEGRQKLLSRLESIYDQTAQDMGFLMTDKLVNVWAPRRGRATPGGYEWRQMRVYEKILIKPPK